MPNLLKVRLSLKGRPIRTYLFDKPTVTIGRNPDADIFLDNTGISRDHAVIERTPGGYQIADLGSANGTLLNDKPVEKDYLSEDDVVQIGKFVLWLAVEGERRDRAGILGQAGPAAFEGTMVLDPDALRDMQRKSTVEITEAPGGSLGPGRRATVRRILIHAAVFLAGLATGLGLSSLSRPPFG